MGHCAGDVVLEGTVCKQLETQKTWTRLGLEAGIMVVDGTGNKQQKTQKTLTRLGLWAGEMVSEGTGSKEIKTQKPWTLLRGPYGSKSTLVDPYINLYRYIWMSLLGLIWFDIPCYMLLKIFDIFKIIILHTVETTIRDVNDFMILMICIFLCF